MRMSVKIAYYRELMQSRHWFESPQVELKYQQMELSSLSSASFVGKFSDYAAKIIVNEAAFSVR